MSERAVSVVRAGALTCVQDEGRPGYAHLGVPRSGALDLPASRLANRLVGNAPGTAVLEATLNGCAVRPRRALTVAVTGAPCAVTVAGRPAAWGAAVRVPAGAVVELGAVTCGVRSYLALAGGIDVDPVLGSRSTDLLSGLGPPILEDSAVLPLGRPGDACPYGDGAPAPGVPGELVLPVLPGPRADWFTADAVAVLAAGRYRVSAASNRIGLRTEGPALRRVVEGELPSEGVVLGAVQVPPDGRPVVFLADHPTTGGYPVIGVVPEPALAAAAQSPPGTPLRFTPRRWPLVPPGPQARARGLCRPA
ncbi:biotin-dependent carboxyltransferase family protein [Streptomyces sp. NPDC006704]|uniref:5-oxoprolinase subunit C family protein n=1 Tax=Streptomyces sp. NPDC006704 TaxID=3364760 RepID=UPI00367EE0E1